MQQSTAVTGSGQTEHCPLSAKDREMMSEQEAIKQIKECLADLAAGRPLRRKRRTIAWLAHCVGELQRVVNQGGGGGTG